MSTTPDDAMQFWMREAFVRGWAASRYRGKTNHKLSDIGRRAAESKFDTWWKSNHE
jgi:hypothetical protein